MDTSRMFKAGPCTCVRCVKSKGDQSGYKHAHTFKDESGDIISRIFSSTDVMDINQLLGDGEITIYNPKDKGKPKLK